MHSLLRNIAEAVKGDIIAGDPNLPVRGISLDSRQVETGSLFFALKGERYDAHAFVADALVAGAAAAVVSRAVAIPEGMGERGLVRVADVGVALQDLARWYRQKFKLHLAAVTGSVGKTTTKDLVALCLQAGYKTLKTAGNYNNEIGVPITLLQLEAGYQACVVEMAMRNRGEIRQLAAITRPTCGIVINVEPVHLENLGTIQHIAEAKCELLEYIESDGFVLINGDDPVLVETASHYPVKKYYFGRDSKCQFRIDRVGTTSRGTDIEADLMGNRVRFFMPVPGSHLAHNVVAAAGLAFMLGISIEAISKALANFAPSHHRLNIKTGRDGSIIIDDCYNANPVSMKAALRVLSDFAGAGARVAVLGDMYELGSYELEGHQEVGRLVSELGIEYLVAVGKHAQHIWQAAREAGMQEESARYFPDKDAALGYLATILEAGMVVLVKASRGMQMEEIVRVLEDSHN